MCVWRLSSQKCSRCRCGNKPRPFEPPLETTKKNVLACVLLGVVWAAEQTSFASADGLLESQSQAKSRARLGNERASEREKEERERARTSKVDKQPASRRRLSGATVVALGTLPGATLTTCNDSIENMDTV